jgi:hypothetical protein
MKFNGKLFTFILYGLCSVQLQAQTVSLPDITTHQQSADNVLINVCHFTPADPKLGDASITNSREAATQAGNEPYFTVQWTMETVDQHRACPDKRTTSTSLHRTGGLKYFYPPLLLASLRERQQQFYLSTGMIIIPQKLRHKFLLQRCKFIW